MGLQRAGHTTEHSVLLWRSDSGQKNANKTLTSVTLPRDDETDNLKYVTSHFLCGTKTEPLFTDS